MPSMDTVRIRTSRPIPNLPEPPRPKRSNQKGSGLVVILLVGIGGFFLLTRPSTNQPTKADSLAPATVTPAATTQTSSGIQINLPQPDTSKPLAETVILDTPLSDSQKQSTATNSAPTTATSTSTETTSTTVQADSFKTRILNGSGTSGAATQAQSDLTKKGFNIISAGTAVNAYSNNVIYYTAGNEGAAKTLRTALGKSSITLSQNDIAKPADVLYVVGKN